MDQDTMRRVKQHVMSWGTGTATGITVTEGSVATVVLEDAGHLDAVSDWVGSGSVVLVPAGGGRGDDSSSAVVAEYAGDASGAPGDLSVGDDFFLQTIDYSSSDFLTVLGPTLVRITSDADLDLFCADVDRAVSEGVFPEFAVAPAVRIADLPALTGELASPITLHVRHDGRVSTSPLGTDLGDVGDELSAIRGRWQTLNSASVRPCAVSLGGAVTEATRVTELSRRPVARHLTVLDALRRLVVNNITDSVVSGFGYRVTDGLTVEADDHDLADPLAPVILASGKDHHVVDPLTGKVHAFSGRAVSALECLLIGGRALELVPDDDLGAVRGFLAGRPTAHEEVRA